MMRRPYRCGTLSLVLVLWASFISSAEAYQRSTDPDTGVELYQDNRQVRVLANEACSAQLTQADCLRALWAGLEAWNGVECAEFAFLTGQTTLSAELGFDAEHLDANFNLLLFIQEGWRHERTALAMTTTTYDANTGRIVDADVEFNEQFFVFGTTGSGSVYDLQSTMAHEAGHMAGLDHSEYWEATMDGHIEPGELEKRDLHPDDEQGLCAIYPPGTGCACAADPDGELSLFASLLLALGLWGLRRR